MCFSAAASFGVGAVLIPAGVYCVKIALERDRAFLPLAAAPLVFGVQQAMEGLVWLGLGSSSIVLTEVGALSFLFFALVFWPAWAPFSAAFIEQGRRKKTALAVISLLALGGGLVVFVPFLFGPHPSVHPEIAGHSLQYRVGAPGALQHVPQGVWQALYVLTIAAPLAVTSDLRFRVFSLLLVGAAVVSHVFFWYAYASVWCFFAAILSLYLCFLFVRLPIGLRGPTPVGAHV